MLVANLSHRFVQDTDWDYSEFALYDLGQAVAHMTLQAGALGLHVRQFRAFDRAGLAAEFAIPAHWEVTTMSAVGRAPADLADPTTPERAVEPARRRRELHELTWPTSSVAAERRVDLSWREGALMTKTLIDIDDDLLTRARAVLGPTATKKDAVNTALSQLVRLHEQRETIDWIIATDPAADLRDPKIRAAARR